GAIGPLSPRPAAGPGCYLLGRGRLDRRLAHVLEIDAAAELHLVAGLAVLFDGVEVALRFLVVGDDQVRAVGGNHRVPGAAGVLPRGAGPRPAPGVGGQTPVPPPARPQGGSAQPSPSYS